MPDPLSDLKERYGFPPERPNCAPFYWCLESGGKELVKDVIAKRDIRLMVEIGVFFGGSALQWLKASPLLTLIGIDPWTTNWAPYFDANFELYERKIEFGGLDRKSLRRQLDGDEATFECLLTNLWDYRDRFIPMRGTSLNKLRELRDLGIAPDLVYIDSDKQGAELDFCRSAFPKCIISGDDWTWKPEEGYPIRKVVLPFAKAHGFEVKSLYGTWLLEPR